MDLIDKKILCLLNDDCRVSLSKLAKTLKVNRGVVEYRIKNLESSGIISKYIASLNLGSLGYTTYKLYFKLVFSKDISALTNYLLKIPEVITISTLQGDFELSIAVVSKTVDDFDSFLMEVRTNFKELIKDIYVSLIVKSNVYKPEKLLLDTPVETLSLDSYSSDGSSTSLDSIDESILSSLSQSANTSLVSLNQDLGYTIDVLKYRLKKLSSSIISSFRLLLDFEKLGYIHYSLLVQSSSFTKEVESKLFEWSKNQKSVLYTTKRIGFYDYELNFVASDVYCLNRFMDSFKEGFGEYVKGYSILLVSKNLKINYVPFK